LFSETHDIEHWPRRGKLNSGYRQASQSVYTTVSQWLRLTAVTVLKCFCFICL